MVTGMILKDKVERVREKIRDDNKTISEMIEHIIERSRVGPLDHAQMQQVGHELNPTAVEGTIRMINVSMNARLQEILDVQLSIVNYMDSLGDVSRMLDDMNGDGK